MHVALRHHAVAVDGGQAEGRLPRHVGRGGTAHARRGAGEAFAARAAGERDERDVAAARRDGVGRVRDERDVRGAAEVGAFGVRHLEVHVLEHRGRAHAGRVARAEVAVDVVFGKAGVFQGARGRLGVELGHGLVGRLARGVLIGADDAGLGGSCRHRCLRSNGSAPIQACARAARRHLHDARSGRGNARPCVLAGAAYTVVSYSIRDPPHECSPSAELPPRPPRALMARAPVALAVTPRLRR